MGGGLEWIETSPRFLVEKLSRQRSASERAVYERSEFGQQSQVAMKIWST